VRGKLIQFEVNLLRNNNDKNNIINGYLDVSMYFGYSFGNK